MEMTECGSKICTRKIGLNTNHVTIVDRMIGLDISASALVCDLSRTSSHCDLDTAKLEWNGSDVDSGRNCNILSLSTVVNMNESTFGSHESDDIDVVTFRESLWVVSVVDWIVVTACSPWLSSVKDIELFVVRADADFGLPSLVSVNEVLSDSPETGVLQSGPILSSSLIWIVLTDVVGFSLRVKARQSLDERPLAIEPKSKSQSRPYSRNRSKLRSR